MRIAIVGYGRMGHEVEAVARERGHEIRLMVDPAIGPGALHATELTAASLSGCDVAVEFSLPDAVPGNVRTYVQAGVPAVIGTTGWLDSMGDLESIVGSPDGAIVYGSNFSVGAHIFFRLAAAAGALVRDLDEYDLLVHELHHRNKKDSPSGTALTLAETVLAEVPRKRRVQTSRLDRAPAPDELHVSSSRGGSLPGTHTLYLDSPADTIEITHRARTRGGFALRTVGAAEWIVGKRGLFTVDQFITDLLEKR